MPTPDYLSGTDEIEPQDLITVWSRRNRDARRVSFSQFQDGIDATVQAALTEPVESANAAAALAQAAAVEATQSVIGTVKKVELATASGGAPMVGYQRDGFSVLRAVGDKLDQLLSFDEYMTPAERTSAQQTTPTLDMLDLTASMQKAIDKNKGYKILARAGFRHHCAGLNMSGSTYNGTELVFDGPLFLRARQAFADTTFGGAWIGLLLRDCEGVTLTFRGHGNRVNQFLEEHNYLLGLAGVRGLTMPLFNGVETQGDGAYIGQREWNAQSPNSDGVDIGIFSVANSVPSGRNAMSVISCDNLQIGTFRSFNVGGIIGGTTHPGGFDIEPNKDYESCKNISIGTLQVVTAGTSGLAIAGRKGVDVTSNVNIGRAIVINTCASSVADGAGAGALTQTPNHTLIVGSTSDVTIGDYQGRFTNSYGDGVIVANSDRVNITGTVRHVREGARIGGDDLDGTLGGLGVRNSVIDLQVSDVSRFGIRTGKVSDSKIKGSVKAPVAGFYPGRLFAVIAISGPGITFTQKNVDYMTDVPSHPDWARSMRNDPSYPVVFENCEQHDADRSGLTWSDAVAQVGDMKMPMRSIRGVTERTTAPPALSAVFIDGQRFLNTSSGGLDVPLGWRYDATANLMRPMSANPFRRRTSRNYALTESFDASLYDIFSLNIQAGPALTYNAPTGGTIGQEVTITVRNVSGGAMGVITWASGFKMAGDWVNPANGKSRSITFFYDGTSWIQSVPVTGDVSN